MADQKKSKKFGRNAKWCQAYRMSARREFNKALRLARHLRAAKHATDRCALAALTKCKAALSVGQLRDLAKREGV